MAINVSNMNHLLIGLGGTGGKILKEFKKRLYLEYPNDAERERMTPAIEFLYVDSTREMMNDEHQDRSWRVLGRDVTFQEREFANIKPQSSGISQILDQIDSFPGMKYLVRNGNAMRQTLGEIREAAGQKRRAGRIMFASSATMFVAALNRKYEDLRRRTRQDSLHIHIFTGLAGGTGSGSIIDVVSQTRKQYPDATIDVYAMIPEKDIPAGFNAGRYHPNGYAALRELSALSVGRFLPCDVVSGDQHIHFLNSDSLKQFSLMLYSNVNDNGITVDSIHELPKLVADTVFYRIFLTNNPSTQSFFRAWSCENLDEHLVEYSAKSKPGDKERARTKAVSTFGIKRIEYPEVRMMEHISYSISKAILWQMQYNNFKEEGIGYVDEPLRKDYNEYIRDDNNLRTWKLDESHLTLNEKILPNDKNVKGIEDFWKEVVTFYSYDDARANAPQPLNFLETYCAEQYKNKFRLKVGVEKYYADKSETQTLAEQSMFIVEEIEKDLYRKWYEGTYSMYDLIGICEAILSYIKRRSEAIEGEIAKCMDKISELNNVLKANQEDYNHVGFVKHLITRAKKDLYSDHQIYLQDLYVEKTICVAKDFEKKLLNRLKSDFEDYQQQMNAFLGKLVQAQEKLIQAIADRTRNNAKIDLLKVIVEVSEDDKMVKFEDKLKRDRTKIDSLASLMRHKLVKEKEFAHFGDLVRVLGENDITDIADQILAPQIRAYHDQDDNFRRDKIIGINVLQQLKKLLQNSPDMDLDIFARGVIQQCGVFLKLNPNELNKTIKNNPNPLQEPFSMNRQCVIVSLPNYEGDEELQAFAHQLETALRNSFGNDCAENPIIFDHSGTKQNEITIVQVRSCFPIRCLEWLPTYKREYDKLINSENEAKRNESRIVLHSEGDGSDLPLLEGEGDGPKGADLISYFFVAAAIGLIKFDIDEREEEGWCMISRNRWGAELKTLISSTFTGIENSEILSSDKKEIIIDGVAAFISDPDLKKSDRENAVHKIELMMGKDIVHEFSSVNSPLYAKYGDAAEKAINMIMKK